MASDLGKGCRQVSPGFATTTTGCRVSPTGVRYRSVISLTLYAVQSSGRERRIGRQFMRAQTAQRSGGKEKAEGENWQGMVGGKSSSLNQRVFRASGDTRHVLRERAKLGGWHGRTSPASRPLIALSTLCRRPVRGKSDPTRMTTAAVAAWLLGGLKQAPQFALLTEREPLADACYNLSRTRHLELLLALSPCPQTLCAHQPRHLDML